MITDEVLAMFAVIFLLGPITIILFGVSVAYYNKWTSWREKAVNSIEAEEKCNKYGNIFFIIAFITFATLLITIFTCRFGMYGKKPYDYERTGTRIKESISQIESNGYLIYKKDKYISPYYCRDWYKELDGNKTKTPAANIGYGYDMVYSVDNDLGITILQVEYRNYFKEDELDMAMEYYENLDDYEFYLSDGSYIMQYEEPYVKPISFDAEMFRYLRDPNENDFPEYVEQDTKGKRFHIIARSPDGVYECEIRMYYNDGAILVYEWHDEIYLIPDEKTIAVLDDIVLENKDYLW